MSVTPSRPAFRWFLLGMAFTVLAVGTLFATVEYPVLSSLPAGAWLVADASCPASLRALQEIRESPALRASVLIVPAELEIAPVRDMACDTLNLQLEERSHWLRLLPDGLTCTLVTNEAVLFRAENFVVSPAWAYDMAPMPAIVELADILTHAELGGRR